MAAIDRRQFLIGGAAATLAGLTACSANGGGSQGPTGGTKNPVYAQSVQITSLETSGGQPQGYPAGYEAAFAIYSGLVKFSPSLDFKPDLATHWEVADDDRTWIFKLRSGVRFHDGTPFTADAVVSYFTDMLDKKYNLSAYTLWEPIKSVEKAGENRVKVITKKPYAALLNTIAHGSALIPSPAAVKKYGKDIGLHPVGTGPYKLDKFDPGSRLVVKAFPGYYGKKQAYDSITYSYVGDAAGRVAALNGGQADIIDAVPVARAKQIDNAPQTKLVNISGLECFGIGLNQTNSALTDRRVRQALNYAVDKDAIVKKLFRGYATVMTSPLAPHTNDYTKIGTYERSVTKARKLLDEAGYRLGPDGVRAKAGKKLKLRLRTPDGAYQNDTKVAQAVQGQLESVGVSVSIQKVDKASFWDGITVPRGKVDFDLVLFGYNPSHGSGVIQLDSLYVTNPSPHEKPRLWNFNWYSNDQVDKLVAKAATTVDDAKRRKVMMKAEQIIWDDAPYIWLYVGNVLTAYDSSIAKPTVLPIVFTLPSRTWK